jgi:argininosuccinate synthase
MKVVLAYSGGLDTSVMIPWIKERYGCEVVAFVADVGQGGDMAKVGAKAIRTGASKCVVRDLQAEFLKAYAFPALRAGAVYEGKYLLGTAIARPCIAKAQVEVALAEHADAVAHGATGKGNDQVRFEMAYMTLAPSLKVIAPWREWDLKSRTDEFAYAEARGIPVPVTRKSPYSMDTNLWHNSIEGGELEELDQVLPDSALRVVTPPARCPARGATVRIGFVRGVPASVNGRKTGPVSLVQALNRLGAAHGIGVVDCVENRLVGMKSRGVYETPGGTLLHAALSELVAVCLDRETVRVRQTLSLKYAEMVYCGQWFTPLRGALDAFMAEAARPLTGEVTLGLGRGLVKVLKRASPFARYRASLATFEEGEAYDQRHAEGFIRLFGLPFRGGAGR